MTPDQKRRIDDLTQKYRFCFMVDGPFHSKYNERRMQKFVDDKQPSEHEFVRVNADLTLVFWNKTSKV